MSSQTVFVSGSVLANHADLYITPRGSHIRYNRKKVAYILGLGDQMLERDYQAYLIRELKERFPGCFVLKNDSSYIQGIPDLLVLWLDSWAMLEVKQSLSSPRGPNQEHYVRIFNGMSFAAFICPENESEVLDDLQQAFQSGR